MRGLKRGERNNTVCASIIEHLFLLRGMEFHTIETVEQLKVQEPRAGGPPFLIFGASSFVLISSHLVFFRFPFLFNIVLRHLLVSRAFPSRLLSSPHTHPHHGCCSVPLFCLRQLLPIPLLPFPLSTSFCPNPLRSWPGSNNIILEAHFPELSLTYRRPLLPAVSTTIFRIPPRTSCE